MKLIKKLLVKASLIYMILLIGLSLPLLLFMYFTYTENLSIILIILSIIATIILVVWGDENE